MIRSLLGLTPAMTVPTFLSLLAKVALAVGVGAVIASALRRQSAAVRHLVWSFAIVLSVGVVAMSPLVPELRVPLPNVLASMGALDVGEDTRAEGADVAISNLAAFASIGMRIDDVLQTGATTVVSKPASTVATPTLVTIAWITGSLLLALWYAAGHVGLARLRRTAQPLTDADWGDTLRTTARELGVVRPVWLGTSRRVGAPVTWGIGRPVILLPTDAQTWSVDRQRVVLLHELAHVRRHDFATQLFARLACVVYWFHPAVWMAARRLRNEGERACDDLVLTRGTPADEYASHLLSVARGSRTLRLAGAVAIGMARRSTLEGRLVAILDEHLARRPAGARARWSATAALGVALFPLAALTPSSRTAHARTVVETPQIVLRDVPLEQALDEARAQQGREGSCSAASDSRSDERTSLDCSLPASAGETLTLDLKAGGDVEVVSSDANEVHVRARVGGRDWRDVSVRAERTSSGVRLTADFDRRRNDQRTDNEFRVSVPRRFNVNLSSAGGAVTISGIEGSFRGTTGGGEILLERLRGRADLSTGGGDIRVRDSELAGTVGTGGGLVRIIGNRGNLRGSSGSGTVVYSDQGSVRVSSAEDRERDVGDRSSTLILRGDRREDARVLSESERESVREEVARAREEAARAREEAREEARRAREEARRDLEERNDRVRDRKVDKEADRRETAREREQEQREREMEAREQAKEQERERAQEAREREQEARERANESRERAAELREREKESREREAEAREARETETNASRARRERLNRDDYLVTRSEIRSEGGRIRINKAGGDVELDEAPNGASIHTGGGVVHVGRADGSVDINTGGGDITVGPVAGSVSATTGAGDVEVTIVDANGDRRSVTMTSGKGHMILTLPRDFAGRFELESAFTQNYGRQPRISSDWDLEREVTPSWDSREGTPRRYVRASGSMGTRDGLVRIKTVNGDIEVRRGR